jgi:hypothetical protein
MRDNLLDGEYLITKDYTDWMVKTGGYARDMTMRDVFAALAMQAIVGRKDFEFEDEVWTNVYDMADAMLKERAK